jgi:putative membrane-bound dehydrogenase-like protein
VTVRAAESCRGLQQSKTLARRWWFLADGRLFAHAHCYIFILIAGGINLQRIVASACVWPGCFYNRAMFRITVALALLVLGSSGDLSLAAPSKVSPIVPAECPPEIKVLKQGIRLTEVVRDPQIVTPTGIDVDASGRIWAVASHTHFRPLDYTGPEHDEILVFTDADGDGRAEQRHLFYNRTVATMDLELGLGGWVYLAERGRILRVRDSDGDGRGDTEENIAVLSTIADYPHNGHSGLAWHPSGDLVFALGENFHKDWTLTGADGTEVIGSGEGGIFRCRPDGSKLRRIAKGFWNPFGVVVRSDGEIFAAENDPGSRPPCRLLHIVPGGDYGFQRRYGESPYHPFVCWNGELRNTLPMVSPVGEAPCGIALLGGGLLVPSWADHRIDFFPLKQKGASYTAERVEIVSGGDHFRPTCIKQVSPTTYFLTDWVFGTYDLHGKGRIWKLEIDAGAGWVEPKQPERLNEAALLARKIRSGSYHPESGELLKLAQSEDPFLVTAAIGRLAEHARFWDQKFLSTLPAAERVPALLALRHAHARNPNRARPFLTDRDPEIVFETLRWITDEQLVTLKSEVGALLAQPKLSYRLFEAALACWNTLNGNPRAGIADVATLIKRVKDEASSPQIRAFSLRLLPPDTPQLKDHILRSILAIGDPLLTTTAVRTFAGRTGAEAQRVLAQLAGDERVAPDVRADAIVGLARESAGNLDLLVRLVNDEDEQVRAEALRALRFQSLSEPQSAAIIGVAVEDPDLRALVDAVIKPESLSRNRPALTDLSAWQQQLGSRPGNPVAGRRIFFHPTVALCATCHRNGGRGTVLGPDLSAVSDRGDHDWLLDAILQPNRDVAPQFYPWELTLKSGEEFVGIMMRKGGRSGKEFYRNRVGRVRGVVKTDIVSRRELKSSMMPEGLLASLTDGEIRDLLAFLNQ